MISKSPKEQHSFYHPHELPNASNHIYTDNGLKLTLDKLLQLNQKRWQLALSNDLVVLHRETNTIYLSQKNVMKFINKSENPSSTPVTYANFVCDHRPLKSEPWRIRLVVGGDKVIYFDDQGSPAANLLETKLLLNSVISDATMCACFMSIDLKDHFLSSPMNTPEYMQIHQKYIPLDIIKGMYGLKQAALLAYNFLRKIFNLMVITQSLILRDCGNTSLEK